MKEFPILAEASVEAARISVAMKDTDPAQYLAFHQELFSGRESQTPPRRWRWRRISGLTSTS